MQNCVYPLLEMTLKMVLAYKLHGCFEIVLGCIVELFPHVATLISNLTGIFRNAEHQVGQQLGKRIE